MSWKCRGVYTWDLKPLIFRDPLSLKSNDKGFIFPFSIIFYSTVAMPPVRRRGEGKVKLIVCPLTSSYVFIDIDKSFDELLLNNAL